MRRLALIALFFACSKSLPLQPRVGEAALRKKLGIPESAASVVVFAQTSHLDIDWQSTFPDYYDAYVRDIFLESRALLAAQPRAYYSIAEMAFLDRHLAQHPEELEALRAQAATGALRIVGGGWTSPDTLLPEPEMLLRDFMYGARFSEDTLGARAHAAWLPDSFGHAGALPDLLAALGYESVMFGRIDGAPKVYEQIVLHRTAIAPGSHAELLQKLGSADFIWRGPGGGRVLAHYQPLNVYCTGDDIDYDEPLQIPGGHIGPYRGDSSAYTDGRIEAYLKALKPYAKTPYLFVPVGCDFQHPKDKLIDYLDGYNARHMGGTYTVAAPFDDYASLVMAHSDVLPELAGELSPYFMGFYGSRASVKRAVRDAARPWFTAEPFAALLGLKQGPGFQELMLSDHHDFITGTATDEVVANEQLPLAARAQAAGTAQLAAVAAALGKRIPPAPGAVARVIALNAASSSSSAVGEIEVPGPVHSDVPLEMIDATHARVLAEAPSYGWRAIELMPGALEVAPQVAYQLLDDGILLYNSRVRARFTRTALVSLSIDGTEVLGGPSFMLHEYADQGGLWRLGQEMQGCSFSASTLPDDDVIEVRDASALSVTVAFRSSAALREAHLSAGSAGLELAVETLAPEGSTRTVSFSMAGDLTTSVAGAAVQRGADAVYSPAYWPAVSWVLKGSTALFLRQSTGVNADGDSVQLMAARDARSEVCDVEGPKPGSDTSLHRIEWRIARAQSALQAERAAQMWNRPLAFVAAPLGDAAGDLPAQHSLAQLEGNGVIGSLKPAERGAGAVLRVQLLPGPVSVKLSPLLPAALQRIDAAERDLPGSASLRFDTSGGTFQSVRLH